MHGSAGAIDLLRHVASCISLACKRFQLKLVCSAVEAFFRTESFSVSVFRLIDSPISFTESNPLNYWFKWPSSSVFEAISASAFLFQWRIGFMQKPSENHSKLVLLDTLPAWFLSALLESYRLISQIRADFCATLFNFKNYLIFLCRLVERRFILSSPCRAKGRLFCKSRVAFRTSCRQRGQGSLHDILSP